MYDLYIYPNSVHFSCLLLKGIINYYLLLLQEREFLQLKTIEEEIFCLNTEGTFLAIPKLRKRNRSMAMNMEVSCTTSNIEK